MRTMFGAVVVAICLSNFGGYTSGYAKGRMTARLAKAKEGITSVVGKMSGISMKARTAALAGIFAAGTCVGFMACERTANDFPKYSSLLGIEDTSTLGINSADIAKYQEKDMLTIDDYDGKLIYYRFPNAYGLHATGVASVDDGLGSNQLVVKGLEGGQKTIIKIGQVESVLISDSEHVGKEVVVPVVDIKRKWSPLPSDILESQEILKKRTFGMHARVSEEYSDGTLLITPDLLVGPGKEGPLFHGKKSERGTLISLNFVNKPIYFFTHISKIAWVEDGQQ